MSNEKSQIPMNSFGIWDFLYFEIKTFLEF